MRIVAIGMVKNEIDIVEAFVRHTLAVADRLVLIDHASSDGTLDVLHALRREGMPLEIIEDRRPGKHQGERLTRLMREYAIERHAADWVLPLDADEIIVPGPDGLAAELATDNSRPVQLPWRSYAPGAGDNPSEQNPLLRITRRLVREPWPSLKVFVPRALAKLADARLTAGNHDLSLGDSICPARPAARATLAHVPIRSAGQYLAKIAIGHLGYLIRPDRQSNWGIHYRQPFERLKRDPAALAADFIRAALEYPALGSPPDQAETIVDPIPYRGSTLRHTPAVDDTWYPARMLADFAEELARNYSAVTAGLAEDEHLAVGRFASVLKRLYGQLSEKDRVIHDQHVENRRMHARLGDYDRELRAAIDHVQRLDEMLQRAGQERTRLLNSWTWRAGRVLVAPGRWLRQAVRRARGADGHDP